MEGIRMHNIKKLFEESKTIVVVGLSSSEEKDSHKVAKYLQTKGYKIIPVHPTAENILGEKVYKSLSDINEEVDIVSIFRPGNECLEITKDAIKLKPKAVWMQLGIFNDEAKKLGEENGIKVIANRCIKIEYDKSFIEFF